MFCAVYGVAFAVIWFAWDYLYPVKLFVVLLHEISHGMAALATGGYVERIELVAAEGGVCFCSGSAVATASAGYLGSLLWGLAMLWAVERFPRRASWMTFFLAAVVAATTVLYLRGGVGVMVGVLSVLVLTAVGRWGGVAGNKILLYGLGITSAFYALLDIRSDVFERPNLQSDATILEEIFREQYGIGIDSLWIGAAWAAVSLCCVLALFRWAWRRAGSEAEEVAG